MNIKDLIKDNKVSFLEYRKGVLYYSLSCKSGSFMKADFSFEGEHEEFFYKYYKFPVPIEDCGDATFPASEKAIMFMRYIRKAMEENTLVEI